MSRTAGWFLGQPEDAALPRLNEAFWTALVGHLDQDRVQAPSAMLDVGCHSGALLARLAERFAPETLWGIEPASHLRMQATRRLAQAAAHVHVCGVDGWSSIPEATVDLAISHEVLYLEGDLDRFMHRVKRVLAPDGAAYVVLGMHADNPTWDAWRPLMAARGHTVYNHAPFEVMAAASRAGLHASVQPLRREGWISYDPEQAPFPYPSFAAMLDHHYRHKLLFRLRHRPS